jgi:uncharacterized membrane-anchored protein
VKAHINGITVEGTPEEIAKYMELVYKADKHVSVNVSSDEDVKKIVEKISKKIWDGVIYDKTKRNPFVVKFI